MTADSTIGMALLAAGITISSSGGATGGIQLYTSIGAATSGLSVVFALIYVLMYLDLLGTADWNDDTKLTLQRTLTGITVPLLITFSGVVVYQILLSFKLI